MRPDHTIRAYWVGLKLALVNKYSYQYFQAKNNILCWLLQAAIEDLEIDKSDQTINKFLMAGLSTYQNTQCIRETSTNLLINGYSAY